MTAEAFDLAERLQTPVIVMTDLDLGMNDHISEPLTWDDSRKYDRGKVLTADQLEQLTGAQASRLEGHQAETNGNGSSQVPLNQFHAQYGRYLDVDGDGIPYRTIPGTHDSKGAFVTRGSSHDEYARYTESSEEYKKNVDRLMRKWETAKTLVPQPAFYQTENRFNIGVLFFGTSSYAAEEAIELLKQDGVSPDAMRVRGFPFDSALVDFVKAHETLFVIEQNRDAQFRSLMMIELGIEPAKLISVLNYDGTPITADNIFRQITAHVYVTTTAE